MEEGRSWGDQGWEQTAEIVAMLLNTSPHRSARSRWWKGKDLLSRAAQEPPPVMQVSMGEARKLLGL